MARKAGHGRGKTEGADLWGTCFRERRFPGSTSLQRLMRLGPIWAFAKVSVQDVRSPESFLMDSAMKGAAYYWCKSSVVPVREVESPVASVSDNPEAHIQTTDVNLTAIRLAWNESSRFNKAAARWTGLSAVLGAATTFAGMFR